MLARVSILLCLALAALAAGARSFDGTVTHVADGDSLWVRPEHGGAPVALRLRGIDAPEGCQAHGPQAREALARRVLRRHVSVTVDTQDDYGRGIAEVHLGDTDVAAWMVREGHAWSYRFRRDPGPYARQETAARQARRGLWADEAPEPPRAFRRRHGRCLPEAQAPKR